jgi:hypothetical protein
MPIRLGGRNDCPLQPRSASQPQSRLDAPGGEAPCSGGVSAQLLVFGGWLY